MKITYAYINLPDAGMMKLVPYTHINRAGKSIIYPDIWMVPTDNARSRQVGKVELLELAGSMGKTVVFKEIIISASDKLTLGDHETTNCPQVGGI